MSAANMKKANPMKRLLCPLASAAVLLLTTAAQAAAPGITGNSAGTTTRFNLVASPASINQPDGQAVYSWGYGCSDVTPQPGFLPTTIATTPAGTNVTCPTMQIPGPTLIVREGTTVVVRLTNNLPTAAGNTSILFPGFNVTTSCANTAAPAGVQGLLTCEAAPGAAVTYTFTASTPGTRAYYSGTQGDLQVEMGLYGAIIVLPLNGGDAACNPVPNAVSHYVTPGSTKEDDFRLASSAYDHPRTCYDREYLFQFSEMDLNIHSQAQAQVTAIQNCAAGITKPIAGNTCPTTLNVPTEPYHPAYFMINGRSMPDDMDPNYAVQYPHQPYNGNPHMHPGELVLLRIIGQGRWQHPFHEHGNHVRVLARDGNLILSTTAGTPTGLAGPLLFTTTTTPGQAMDGIFYWTGRGLNWDPYGHNPASASGDPLATLPCDGLLGGGYHSVTTDLNYYEWCQDHNKPLQAKPFGDVAGGGPVTLPDPNLFTNGAWFGGSPYLGPNATVRATGPTGTTPPSGTIANPPTSEAGFAFMWHSHNEREITTNNIFPGGMLMMMLVDSREFRIDESL
jgi:FtsP/CotA-like multicopper oxidase with cupredoxin domain